VARPVKYPERLRRQPANPARRKELLRIAAQVFAENGYAHTRMNDVAAAAGILPGSLYHHFRSKDDLLLELMQGFSSDMLTDLNSIVATDDEPLDKVTALIRLALHFIVERGPEARILSNDYQHLSNTPIFKKIMKANREAETIWMETLRAGITAGQLRQDLNPKIAYATLMGSIFSALRWYRRTGRIRPAAFTDQVCHQLLKGIQA
jgi:TetR/AcrR family transcriptional regulator, cholesterol catabolism regulator